MIDVRTLSYFIARCEHENLGSAAKALAIAPSTLSASLKSLKQEFGISMLIRSAPAGAYALSTWPTNSAASPPPRAGCAAQLRHRAHRRAGRALSLPGERVAEFLRTTPARTFYPAEPKQPVRRPSQWRG